MSLAILLSKENNNFDLLRLLASIMVIYAHSFVLASTNGQKDVFNFLTDGITDGGSLAVKFFFFLSGLLVTNSLIKSDNIPRFAVSRFFRIYPAFIAVVILTVAVLAPTVSSLTAMQFYTHAGTLDYLKNNATMHIAFFLPGVFEANIYPGSVNGSLWTIPYEISAYILLLAFYVIFGFKQRLKYLTIVLLSIIILPIFKIGNGLFAQPENHSVALLAPCFAMGALLAIHKQNIQISIFHPLAFFAIYFLSLDAYLKSLSLYFAFSYLMLYLGTRKIICKVKIKYDISYGVYLWGFVVQQTVYYYLPNLHLYVNQILSIVLTIFLAIPTYILIEKPAMNIGRRFNQKFFP